MLIWGVALASIMLPLNTQSNLSSPSITRIASRTSLSISLLISALTMLNTSPAPLKV